VVAGGVGASPEALPSKYPRASRTYNLTGHAVTVFARHYAHLRVSRQVSLDKKGQKRGQVRFRRAAWYLCVPAKPKNVLQQTGHAILDLQGLRFLPREPAAERGVRPRGDRPCVFPSRPECSSAFRTRPFTPRRCASGRGPADGRCTYWATRTPCKMAGEGNGQTGNAMLLPVPAVPRTMTPRNCISTRWCPRILKDYSLALFPPRKVYPRSSRLSWRSAPPPAPRVEVFETGIYTVVLAEDARAIPAALDRVPPAKRPVLNQELFEAYSAWYPAWTFALCCFNNRHQAQATPLLWWYEPMHPDELFAPAVDCHTGAVPDLKADVPLDHTLVVGSYQMQGGQRVRFRDWFRWGASPYLVRRVIGGRPPARMPNGDFVFRLEDVRAGHYRFRRVKPPAA
jgi:hypothetical protein